jgi:hypothetical protein
MGSSKQSTMTYSNQWITMEFGTTATICTLDFSQFQELSRDQAIRHTVDRITSDYKTLHVCLSGGIDSEFAATCLYNHGVDFVPIILDLEFNGAEVWYAFKWCRDHNIEPWVIPVTPQYAVEVLSHRLPAWPGASLQSLLEYIPAVHVQEVGGSLITGGAEPFDRLHCLEDRLNRPASTQLQISTLDHGLRHYHGHDHPGGFVDSTPELWISLVRDLDYTKPVQLALSEYYGVMPRPKIPGAVSYHLVPGWLSKSQQLRQQYPTFKFPLGKHDSVLEQARSNSVMQVTGIED